jgi:uncharacterized protein (DUF983 family)
MSETPPSAPLSRVSVAGRCPRCGEGRLFKNVLELRPACEKCGLDYKFIDTGDGPAIFAIFILGFLVLGGALVAEFKFGVSFWGHVLLLGIGTPLIAIVVLRLLKGLLIALQYRNKAEQGRLEQ